MQAGQTIELDLTNPTNPLPNSLNLPETTTAVNANITAAQPQDASYVTAYPCDVQRPNASNLNIAAWQPATANGSLTKLSADGRLCLYSLKPLHLIVDINGYWTPNN